jgi:hypothetical protein
MDDQRARALVRAWLLLQAQGVTPPPTRQVNHFGANEPVASPAAPTLPQVPDEPPRETTDPDGRLVRFDERTEAHLARRRPPMVRHVPAILDAIRRPDLREEDTAPGRARVYRFRS